MEKGKVIKALANIVDDTVEKTVKNLQVPMNGLPRKCEHGNITYPTKMLIVLFQELINMLSNYTPIIHFYDIGSGIGNVLSLWAHLIKEVPKTISTTRYIGIERVGAYNNKARHTLQQLGIDHSVFDYNLKRFAESKESFPREIAEIITETNLLKWEYEEKVMIIIYCNNPFSDPKLQRSLTIKLLKTFPEGTIFIFPMKNSLLLNEIKSGILVHYPQDIRARELIFIKTEKNVVFIQ